MKAEDTVMSPQEISKIRRRWASGQIVGESPQNDLIKAQAEISFKAVVKKLARVIDVSESTIERWLDDKTKPQIFADAKKEGIRMYAWWKDGIQYVGTTGRTLKEALEE